MIYCCGCEKDVETREVTGEYCYPHRKDLYKLWFHECVNCGLFVGSHKSTGSPLGVIATQEIKNMRSEIHSIIDPLWKQGFISRTKLYKRMSIDGRHYHTANLRSVNECEIFLARAKEIRYSLLSNQLYRIER